MRFVLPMCSSQPIWLLSLLCVLAGCNASSDNQSEISAKQFRVAAGEKTEATATKETGKSATVAATENKNLKLPDASIPPMVEASATDPATTKSLAPSSEVVEKTTSEQKTPGNTKIPAVYAQKLKELDSLSLNKLKPRGSTQEQQMQYISRAMQTRLHLAEELAGDPNAPEPVRNEALMARMSCLMMMIDPNQPETRAAFVGAANDLAGVKDPQFSSMGKVQLFSLKVIEIFQLKPNDGQEVLKSIENMLQEVGEAEAGFEASARVVQMMQEQGWEDDVIAALALIAKHYEKSDNPQIILQVMSLQVNSLLMQYQKADDAQKSQFHAQILKKLEEMVAASEQSPQILNLILQVSSLFESTGKMEDSLAYLTMAKTAFEKSTNPKILQVIDEQLASAKKRTGLVGQKFVVEGLLLNGEKFDWSPYKGKVVLIDFWATWCAPCLEEIPNIEANYETYRDQGFEVVGISMDDTTAEVKEFLDKQPLPWPTVFTNDPAKFGYDCPMAQRCGVNAIPFVVLVGKDGKVDGIHMRGKRLGERLEKLFGVASANPKPPATKENAPEVKPGEVESPAKTEPTK